MNVPAMNGGGPSIQIPTRPAPSQMSSKAPPPLGFGVVQPLNNASPSSAPAGRSNNAGPSSFMVSSANGNLVPGNERVGAPTQNAITAADGVPNPTNPN